MTYEDVVKTGKAEQSSFVYEISILLAYLQLIASRFDKALNSCSSQTFTNLGSIYLDLNIQEKTIDSLLDMLQKDQLDETANLESLDKSCYTLHVNKP